MERENVETVNPDSTLHTRSRCAPSLGVMIPPLTPDPRTTTAKPLPFLFSSDPRQNAPRLCIRAISIGRRLTYLSEIPLFCPLFVAKLIKRRARFLCALRRLFQICNWINQFENAIIRIDVGKQWRVV